jgi:hypothetical protein
LLVFWGCATGAAQAGDKKMAKEFFMKARQAAVYVGGDSSDYTLAEVSLSCLLFIARTISFVVNSRPSNFFLSKALVSIVIFAHTEGEMDDREMHQILDKAMQICHRVPALNR